jgi:predicted ArsR family transcriptional regulator
VVTPHTPSNSLVSTRQRAVIISFKASELTVIQVAAQLRISGQLLSRELRGLQAMSTLRVGRLEVFFLKLKQSGQG